MHRISFAVAAVLGMLLSLPAHAAGEIVITQAKALAGNITPGDTAGFPVTLSQPGAYVLESNISVPPGIYGLFVTSKNVDIDMNGFTLTGNGGGTYGVISGFGESRIHDGVINRFKYSGIYLRSNTGVIEDMQIVRNGGFGIDGRGAYQITVRRSTIASNGSYGVLIDGNGVVENSNVFENAYIGITFNYGGVVKESQVNNNGFWGIAIDNGGLVVGNSVRNNAGYGIGSSAASLSLINNFLYFNNETGAQQIYNGTSVYGNICVGKPCYPP